MKKDLVELVFILDKSGSMAGLESDTIGGYNSVLQKQKDEPGDAVVTTVLFDNNYELLHDRINIKGVKPITAKEYYVEGSTALLDAVGKTISKIGNAQANTSESEQAEKVLFVITTDGMENSSCEYSFLMIKNMVELQKKKYGWEFLFLGANIDAAMTASQMGIDGSMAANFHADSQGMRTNFRAINSAVSNMRASKPMADWKEEIDEDFNKRGKK